MPLIYKTLLEVKLLHEYYLTDSDGSTIFDKASQDLRLSYLEDRSRRGMPSIDNDLSYTIPDPVQSTFSHYHLRLIPAYSGFRIMIQVIPVSLPGNITAYQPLTPLPDDLPIIIFLNRKNPFLDNFTNSRVQRILPAGYFFTNQDIPLPRTFPFLSSPVAPRDNSYTYEQGELSLNTGTGLLEAFFSNKTGSPQWLPVKGLGYLHEGDRLVVPQRFTYRFPAGGPPLTQVSFTLKNNNGTTLKAINYSSITNLSQASLDFSGVNISGFDQASTIGTLLYSLEVSGNNGYSQMHSLIFYSDAWQVDPPAWGIVCFRPASTSIGNRLLDDQSLLFTRLKPDGTRIPAPVFEIRIKSRYTFWEYVNNKRQKILANNNLNNYLDYDAANGIMVSLDMRSASYLPTIFEKGGVTLFLPNPAGYGSFRQGDHQRYYSEILVPAGDPFKIN